MIFWNFALVLFFAGFKANGRNIYLWTDMAQQKCQGFKLEKSGGQAAGPSLQIKVFGHYSKILKLCIKLAEEHSRT